MLHTLYSILVPPPKSPALEPPPAPEACSTPGGCGRGRECALCCWVTAHPTTTWDARRPLLREALFDTHGYAPLAKFYGMEGGKEAYAEYGEIVCKELAALVEKASSTRFTLKPKP